MRVQRDAAGLAGRGDPRAAGRRGGRPAHPPRPAGRAHPRLARGQAL